MSDYPPARYLRALAENVRAGDVGEGPTRPDPDTYPCGMPLGDGRQCTRPGDHPNDERGCQEIEVAVIPRCRCAHSDYRHVGARYRCMRPGCGCTRYRPVES